MSMSNQSKHLMIINDQTTHEHQVSTSVSTLAVASVAHPEENSLPFSANTVTQVNSSNTKPEQISSVSYCYK